MVVVVSKQGHAQQAMLPAPLLHMFQQLLADSAAAMGFCNDDVLEQPNETAFGSTDGEEDTGHGDDLAIEACYEELAALGIIQDQAQTARLFFHVRLEVVLLGKELTE